jgi:hypothetical protein
MWHEAGEAAAKRGAEEGMREDQCAWAGFEEGRRPFALPGCVLKGSGGFFAARSVMPTMRGAASVNVDSRRIDGGL